MSEDDWCYQLDAHEYSKQDPSLGEIIILAIFTFVVCMFRPFLSPKCWQWQRLIPVIALLKVHA